MKHLHRLSPHFRLVSQRVVYAVAPGEENAVNLAEAQLRPEQRTLLSTESKRVREAVEHLLGQSLTTGEQVEVKPKEFSAVALSRAQIKAAVIKDGMILVQSEEGIQGYVLDEEKGLKGKPGALDLSAEVSADVFTTIDGKPVEVLPHIPALRSRQMFDSLGKWEAPTKNRVIHPAQGMKLEPRLTNGEDGKPQHEIKLHTPQFDIPMTLHALPRGEFLKSWAVNIKSGLHGSFVELHLKSSPDEQAEEGTNQSTLAFFVDGQGNLLHLEPSPEKAFPQYSVEGLELISLGNTLVIKKEKELEVVNIPVIDGFPALGKMREQVMIGHTLYVSFAGTGGKNTTGQFVLAINPTTGKVDKSKGTFGIFAGEAVVIDRSKQQVVVLSDGKHTKKNVKKLAAYDVTELKTEKKFQALTPAGAKEVQEAVRRFGQELNGDITPANLDQIVGSMRQLVGDIGFATSDQRVGQFEALIASGIRTLEGLRTEAVREETVRRAEIAKLKEIEDEFDRAIMSLPMEHAGHLGTLVRRLREYLNARTTFISKRAQLHHLPADRFAESERMLQAEDASKADDRRIITESIPGHIQALQAQGGHILTDLQTASGDEGYKQVGRAKEVFERQWEPLYKLLKEIQRSPEVFLDESNATVKSTLDETTVRGREAVNLEAPQNLRLAQIEHAYGELYARAVQQNVDPEKAEVFEHQIAVIRGHAERLYEETSAGEVDQRLGRLQQDLLKLEQGTYTEGALMHSPKHRQLLESARDQLQAIALSAKESLLRLQDREKKALLRLIQDKTNKLTAQILWNAQRQESEAGMSPDEQSRQAWNRVQMLVMGYDLLTGSPRPGLPETAYSPALKELDELIEKFAKKYSDQETSQSVWRDIRNAVAAASNRIEADKGYAHREGYYTFVLPECYQGRVDQRIDAVQLPLSGKDDVRPLRLATDVDASGRWPVLKMSLIGNEYFERTLPLGDELVDVLPALYWGTPQDDQLAKCYEGPEVDRESVAFSLLLEMIAQRTTTRRVLENLNKKYPGNEEALREEVLKRLLPLFEQLEVEKGLCLSSEERSSLSRTLAQALQQGLRFVKTAESNGQSPSYQADFESIDDLKERMQTAGEFRKLYEEDLVRLHQYTRRNERRIARQLGLSQQQEVARLPHDFRETGLNIVQMRELMNALHIVATSPDKQGIVLTGDFGSGKTMLVTALAERKKQRLHAIKGNKFENIKSIDPYTANETNQDQLFLLAGTLTNMKGVITLLDEMQFLPADVLNSLFDTLDVRGELNVTMALDPKVSAQDIDAYKDVNKTVKGNTFIMTGNLSYTIEEKNTGRRVTVNFVLPEALSRRVVKLSTDDIEEQNEFLWTASYIERGSADLGIHPDDVKYLISRRLKHGHFQTALPVAADDENLKTDFSTDPERLQEIIRAIDYRCLAATILVGIQKASRKTRQHGADLSKLGMPPCWMTAVGGGNVKTLMPLLNHTLRTEQEARAIIREQLMGNTDDRGPEHKEENKLFLEHITDSWKEYSEKDWKEALERAKRLKDEGESVHPYSGPIRAIRGGLDQLGQSLATAQGAAGASHEKLAGSLQAHNRELQQLIEMIGKQLAPEQEVRTQILHTLAALGEQNKAYQIRLEALNIATQADRKAFEQQILTQGQAITELTGVFRKFVEQMAGGAVTTKPEPVVETDVQPPSVEGGLERSLEIQRKEAQEARQALTTLQSQIEGRQKAFRELQSAVQQAEERKNAIAAEVQSLEGRKSLLVEERQKADQQRTGHQAALEKASQELGKLRREMEQARAELGRYAQQKDQLDATLAKLRTEKAGLEKDMAAQRGEVEKAQRTLSQLQGSVAPLQEEIAAGQKEWAGLQTRLQTANGAVRQAEARKEAAETASTQVEGKKGMLENTLGSFLAKATEVISAGKAEMSDVKAWTQHREQLFGAWQKAFDDLVLLQQRGAVLEIKEPVLTQTIQKLQQRIVALEQVKSQKRLAASRTELDTARKGADAFKNFRQTELPKVPQLQQSQQGLEGQLEALNRAVYKRFDLKVATNELDETSRGIVQGLLERMSADLEVLRQILSERDRLRRMLVEASKKQLEMAKDSATAQVQVGTLKEKVRALEEERAQLRAKNAQLTARLKEVESNPLFQGMQKLSQSGEFGQSGTFAAFSEADLEDPEDI